MIHRYFGSLDPENLRNGNVESQIRMQNVACLDLKICLKAPVCLPVPVIDVDVVLRC